MSSTPDWLAPGSRVVCYSTGGAGTTDSVRVTTIKRVNAKTFSVEASSEPKFPVEPDSLYGHGKRIGGTWGYVRHCVSADSQEGKRQIRGMQYRNAIRDVDDVYKTWRQTRSDVDREALIRALEVVGSVRQRLDTGTTDD